MDHIQTFGDIISYWGTAAAFGRDIGVGDVNGRAMKRRNSIPSKYWPAVISSLKERGISNVTYETLARLAGKNGHG